MRVGIAFVLCLLSSVVSVGCGKKNDIVGKWKTVNDKTPGTSSKPHGVVPWNTEIAFEPDGTIGGFGSGTWKMLDTRDGNYVMGPLRFEVSLKLGNMTRGAIGRWDPEKDQLVVFDQLLQRVE